MADFCGIGTSIPSTDDGDMFSKVELELRKKYDRRGYSDATSNKVSLVVASRLLSG